MNHITKLKGKAPYGYRKTLQNEFDIPYWKVGAILEGRVPDYIGLLEFAYQLAIEHQKKNKSNKNHLNSLISELSKL